MDRLPLDSRREVNYLVEMPRRGIVDAFSKTISKGSLCSKLEEEFDSLMPKEFSSNITFLLMIIRFLISLNS